MVDVNVHVIAVRQSLVRNRAALTSARRDDGAALERYVNVFTLANGNAARQSPGIVVNPVVGDLNVVSPGMHKDSATTLRTITDAQSVDAGRVAPEIGGIRIISRAIGAIGSRKQHAVVGERRLCSASEHICRTVGNIHALS